MLYLLQTYGEDFSLLKIGFSENLDKRLKLYYECNPLVKILSTKKKDIKRMLMKISGLYGYKTKLRAIDLGKFFNIKGVLIPNKGTRKRDAGFKILSIKE